MTFMTRQHIFNTAYHGLASQGFEKSQKSTGGILPTLLCVYRGPQGRRCAIGYCISDDIAKRWESRTIQGLSRLELEAAGFSYRRDFEFLKELQQAHDFSTGPESMKNAIHKLALQYGLTIPTLPVSADGVNVEVADKENQDERWHDFEPAE